MKNLAGLDRPNIIRTDGNQGDGLAATIDELDFVPLVILVDVHNGANVAASQPLVGWLSIEYNEGVLRYHGSARRLKTER